jgi:hypothetical protein
METKPSANHLTAIALLAQSEFTTSLSITEVTLEGLQELVFLFGGRITTREVNDHNTPFITFGCMVGSCHVFASQMVKNIAVINQQSTFGGLEMGFVKGTKLTIIDGQYLVLSENQD